MSRLPTFVIRAITTCGFVGFLPIMPGTFGSLVGLACFYVYRHDWRIYLLATLLLMVLGFMLSGKAEKAFNKKDPRYIVIDEVVGMMVSLAFLPHNSIVVIAGFFLFRLLDTLKPYPAFRLQNLHGSAGIMCDDIIAGVYTNIVLQAVVRGISCKVS